jgi:lysozyme
MRDEVQTRTYWLLGGLGAAIALYLLSRTERGAAVAADIVGAVVDKSRELVARFEGLRLAVYNDQAGLPTIGYGHLIKSGEQFSVITVAQAEALLDADLAPARDAVAKYVSVPLNDNQRAALISLVFNIGVGAFSASTLLRLLNEYDYIGAAAQFPRWVYAGGKVSKGLQTRREAEKALFLS